MAAQLDRDAAVLWPPGKRSNAVDRHTADLFRAKAQWIRDLAEAKRRGKAVAKRPGRG